MDIFLDILAGSGAVLVFLFLFYWIGRLADSIDSVIGGRKLSGNLGNPSDYITLGMAVSVVLFIGSVVLAIAGAVIRGDL